METIPTRQHFAEAAAAIRQATSLQPKIAIVLGSGLSGLADAVQQAVSIDYRDEQFRPRRWNHLPPDLAELVQHELDHLNGVLMTDLAEGDNAVQPLSRWAERVGSARPASGGAAITFPPPG